MVLVVVDTLRADRLGAYGSSRGLTPFLDSLAERSYVFRSAYAASSWTNPSVASLLTSRHPSQHGVVAIGSVLAPREVTVVEVLRENGYSTAGFVANILLGRGLGFHQGYDAYEVRSLRGNQLGRRALAWLDRLPADRTAPFLLYLHYMEPHVPYAPTEAALEKTFGRNDRPDLERVSESMRFARRSPPDPEMSVAIEKVYDASVASVDEGLRRLFAGLEKRGLREGVLVVLTSDHGEELLEHGWMGHAHSLYDELIHVPLIVQLPGQSERVDVDAVVSLVDLAPTLLDLAGASPSPAFEGRSLFRSPDASTSPAFAELPMPLGREFHAHQRAVITEFGKGIAGADGEREFYARPGDPAEKIPSGLSDAQRASLEQELERFATHAAETAAPRTTAPLSAEERERLKTLGYLDPEAE